MKAWKSTGKRTTYKTDYFTVYEHDVVRPDGTESNYYIVDRHGPFSIVLPIDKQDQVYMVKQYRFPIGVETLEFPMGSVNGLDPLGMAKQELSEETGLHATNWQELGWYYLAPGFSNQKAYVYQARELVQKQANPEPGEFLEVVKYPLIKIPELIKKGIITDGPTITAWQLFELYNR